ncbi:MAG: galactokinase, partial [Gemmatimonadales bacterium]|nr:galactokinase [Gemmatimonadales bacterium]
MLDPASNLWNQRLAEAFGTVYGGLPTLLARAPGRVNLLGEHTDYNALPVLPMALQREARLALRPRDDGIVRIQNLDRDFDSIEFEVHPRIPASAPGHWENYCKAPAD